MMEKALDILNYIHFRMMFYCKMEDELRHRSLKNCCVMCSTKIS